jgi:hypothetical protein
MWELRYAMDAAPKPSLARFALFFVTVSLCTAGGCASRFFARTDYLAPGFNRDSFRGKTIAVVPSDAEMNVGAYHEELAGIVQGINEAGARARVVEDPAPAGAADARLSQRAQRDDAAAATASAPTTQPRLMGLADRSRRLGRSTDAAYALVVRFTDAVVYRAYARPEDRGGAGRAAAAERTSGRRVGVELELVRLPDGEPQWVAHGSGEAWNSRTAAAPGAMPAAANVDEDIGGGNLDLYPDPPAAADLSRRLVRRLLAHVPFPVEVLPS